jgi:hypothetical protein
MEVRNATKEVRNGAMEVRNATKEVRIEAMEVRIAQMRGSFEVPSGRPTFRAGLQSC